MTTTTTEQAIAWRAEHESHGIDARGRPVSRRVTGRAPRPLTPTRDRRGVGWITVRWRGHSLRYSVPRFAAECWGGGAR